MLISFLGGPDESELSEGVGQKRNSGLRPRDSLIIIALQRPAAGGEGCRSTFGATKSRRERDSCKGPAASGKGKGTRSVANPPARMREKASAELQNIVLPNLSKDDYYKPSHKGLQSFCESTFLGKRQFTTSPNFRYSTPSGQSR